jgi:Tol biopolymer transport system component/DNA-binding winged helix-turn-helix (wHTH) protein
MSQNSSAEGMSSQGKRFYEFGPYRVDSQERVLWRGKQPVALQPKAFDTLLVLLQSGEGDTIVEESNLSQTIFVLRKALGESGSEHRYIVTVPGRGYRFAQTVHVVANEEAAGDSATRDPSLPPRAAEAASAAARTSRRGWIAAALAGVFCLALIAAFVFRPTVPPPKVLRIRQLTQLGTLIYNTKLITDGPRVYFRIWDGHERVIRYVSASGGDPVPVDRAFPHMDIDDISPDGSQFLVVEMNRRGVPPPLWWIPVPLGSPRPVGTLHTREARCSSDGRTIVYTSGRDLYLANSDGSSPRKFATLPGEAIYLQWSPDGERLRFSVTDPQTGNTSLWEGDRRTGAVHPMFADWPSSRRSTTGGWTPDGKYFFFTSLEEGTSNVWAVREPGETLRKINPRPVQLTAGPLNFYQPTPSRDGKSIYAVGEQVKGELVRYDASLREFVPFSAVRSGDEVAFSRDAQWIAYVEYPSGVLVRSRADGSDRRQLTLPPMRAYNPQWSPDGTQIAFEAAAEPKAPSKIYLLSRDGGVPVEVAADRNDRQRFPSWSAQGNAVVFTSFEEPNQTSALYSVDLESRHISLLPGTAGLIQGQVSPDGRQIAALADYKLAIYDTTSQAVKILEQAADFPHWSADGKFVSFRTPYFGPPIQHSGTFRWIAATNKIEKLVSDPDFRLNGLSGAWAGLTPEGSVLLFRDLTSSDLYVLELELP